MKRIIILFIMVLMLTACGQQPAPQPTATPQPTPTPTAEPTVIPQPTATPKPTTPPITQLPADFKHPYIPTEATKIIKDSEYHNAIKAYDKLMEEISAELDDYMRMPSYEYYDLTCDGTPELIVNLCTESFSWAGKQIYSYNNGTITELAAPPWAIEHGSFEIMENGMLASSHQVTGIVYTFYRYDEELNLEETVFSTGGYYGEPYFQYNDIAVSEELYNQLTADFLVRFEKSAKTQLHFTKDRAVEE